MPGAGRFADRFDRSSDPGPKLNLTGNGTLGGFAHEAGIQDQRVGDFHRLTHVQRVAKHYCMSKDSWGRSNGWSCFGAPDPVKHAVCRGGDPNSETAFREALRKPDGALLSADILNLTHLVGSRVSRRDGLSAAHNLGYLELTDLDFLGAVPSVTDADVSNNLLSDVRFPGGLTNLTILLLAGNPVTLVRARGQSPHLAELYLDGSGLSSLQIPPGFTTLRLLSLTAKRFTTS